MDPTQELTAMKKSLKKAKRAYKKLEKKQHGLRVKICESEKEKARKDRVTFLKNIQVSKVPSLLKRRLPADDDEDSTALRDYTFGISDVFTQITQHLGPMEYFMFSRTSKSIAVALNDSFDVWACLFLECLDQETDSPLAFRANCKPALIRLVEKFQKIKHHKDAFFLLMPRLLSVWQETFVKYRVYGGMYKSIRVYHSKRLRVKNPLRVNMFVMDDKSLEMSRASEHNLLFSSHTSKEIGRITRRNFYDKHGFSLIIDEDDDDANILDYFRYDDFNALNLNRAVRDKNYGHGIFMLDLVEGEIREVGDNSKFSIYVLDLPYDSENEAKSKCFCDEYEFYYTVRATKSFKPIYYSITGVTLMMDALLSK